MRFEWDEAKNRANRAKHGIEFEEAMTIFEGPVWTAPDNRRDYGEARFLSFGRLGDLVVVAVVHTVRGEHIRLISARRASRRESQAYHEHLERTTARN